VTPRQPFTLWEDGEESGVGAVVFGDSPEDAVRRWVERDAEFLAAAQAQSLTVLARNSEGLTARVRVTAETHVWLRVTEVDRPRPEGAAP